MLARKEEGFACWISARASSASPLTRAKRAVKRPGEVVAPAPETWTKWKGCLVPELGASGEMDWKALAAARGNDLVISIYSLR